DGRRVRPRLSRPVDADSKMDEKHSAAAPPASPSSSVASASSSSVDAAAPSAHNHRVGAREAKANAVMLAFMEQHVPTLTPAEKAAVAAAEDTILSGQRHAIHYAVRRLVNKSINTGAEELTDDDFIGCGRLHPKRKKEVRDMPEADSVVVDNESLKEI